MTADTDPRRSVPRTDDLLADPRLVLAAGRLGRDIVKRAIGSAQDAVRRGEIAPGDTADAALASLPDAAGSLRPVINATGVVVHTNLGRAPLSAAALAAVVRAAGYTDLEWDAATGQRSRRGAAAIDALLGAVPGAEDAHVVNNGAAAVVLAVTALAAGREVLVSRGELVEIGDGFRLPDLLVSTGARLCEVGTTNRTVLDDYAGAVGADTALVLKVHPSNFAVTGFTADVTVAELATLGLPVVVDIGSGLLTRDPLLAGEPTAEAALASGADLVTASGDKLLGGPQAGLILGRASMVQTVRRHPLARAMRVDKLTLAALEATLAGPPTPVSTYLHADPEGLRSRADGVAKALQHKGIDAMVVASDGVVGGGGAPAVTLPGWAVAVDERMADALRTGSPCVAGRTERGRLLLDLRCVEPSDDEVVIDAVVAAAVGRRTA